MSNTYTQLLIHLVFAVKGRQSLISEKHREKVEKYICGIINKKQCKPLVIYCNPDHIHILIGLHPAISISELMRVVKSNSSKWINENNWLPGKFSWQEGFGAFSCSRSQLDRVVKYIRNQPEHHRKKTFREEYIEFLKKYEIEFDEKFTFDFLE